MPDYLLPIHNQGQDFLVDSRDVAATFNLTHQHIREQIEEHESEIARLGVFRVESGKPLAGSTGGRPERYYWLNFDQTVYLLTLTKPTEQNREYHVRLILAFRKAREQLRPVDTILLSIPEEWRKTFRDEFYVALLRIYGDSFDASKNNPSSSPDFTPAYHQFFKANPSPKWVNEDTPFSLDQPWPYDFPPTDLSNGAVARKGA